jgi:hypothetical protein
MMNARACLVLAALITLWTPGMSSAADREADAGVPTCRRLPRNARMVKVILKPDSVFAELINLYGVLTCKRLQLAGGVYTHKFNPKIDGLISVRELGELVKAEAKKAGIRYSEDEDTVTAGP